MKFWRQLLVFTIIFSCFWHTLTPVQAASQDISVTCTGSDEIDDCVISPSGGKIFDEQHVLPGDTFIQFIDIANSTNQPLTAAISPQTVSSIQDLADAMVIEIRASDSNGQVIIPEQTLSTFLSSTDFLDLSVIDSQQSQRYAVIAQMSWDAGNQYQGSSTEFDLAVNIQLSSQSATSPTPTPTATASASQSQVAGANTSEPCSDSTPDTAPVLFTPAAVDANGQVTLTWTSVSPVTTYAINFGIQSGVYLFGNANVGNVTSYTVSGLTPNTQYYFQVLGINGCAPGPRSNEVVTPGQPTTIVLAAPEGFSEGEVLGESTEESVPSSPIISSPSYVLSAQQVKDCSPISIWLAIVLLIGQAGIILLAKFFFPESSKLQFAATGFSTLLSVALFYIISSCSCETVNFFLRWCGWYWLIAIIESLVLQFVPIFGQNEQTEHSNLL